jgi:hypothetical protein
VIVRSGSRRKKVKKKERERKRKKGEYGCMLIVVVREADGY